MNDLYRLNLDDLYQVLGTWDEKLPRKVFLAACGGTALTLYGYKESTKDVDFLIPNLDQYDILIRAITKMNYKKINLYKFDHPNKRWQFDLYRGQTIFETGLLDPVQDEGRHRVIKSFKNIILACINPEDLIISKMFRGSMVDVQDSIIMIKAENMDLTSLAQRYRETAGYYIRPEQCKTNLHYLIQDLETEGLDPSPLKEMSDLWNP
jgi:hypothetical protein